MIDVLQKMQDSEINWQIGCFYDNIWTWRLGDEMNGFKVEGTSARSFGEAVDQLIAQALIQFPNSDFAKYWQGQAA